MTYTIKLNGQRYTYNSVGELLSNHPILGLFLLIGVPILVIIGVFCVLVVGGLAAIIGLCIHPICMIFKKKNPFLTLTFNGRDVI